jgi:hypothetical protein
MDNLFITFHAFLLLFIFLAGGVNKIANFQGTADFLETKVNALELNPIFKHICIYSKYCLNL